jgi:uncharacterized membrane protein
MRFAITAGMKPITLLLFLIVSVTAQACPFCNTNTAAQIRAKLSGPGLAMNVGVLVLPFLVVFIVVTLIYRDAFRFNKNAVHHPINFKSIE